ncbi:MAG TPA: hypothetical protein PLK78_06890 [Verrucomicrobiota bacterium]|nr:hypothetical protein [Verrucomicrobiota bacterium]
MPALAQSVAIRSQPLRVTVPDADVVNQFVLTNFVDLGEDTDPVELSISGLPAGAGASFSVTSFEGDGGTELTLNTTNIAQGEHVISLNASGGATGTFPLVLQSGRVWDGTGSWSSGANWVGGVVPGPTDDVIFTDLGGQADATVTNSVVDADIEIASLRFSQTNNATRFHTVEINPGVTLSVTGEKGFRLLRDYSNIGAQMDVNFVGGGTLLVSNENANVSVVIPNQQAHRLNLSGLANFVVDAKRMALGDYRAYPNYDDFVANGYGGNATFLIPRRFIPTVSLARTNIIRLSHVDPNDYNDPAIRDYALTLGNNDVGTTADSMLLLGISNVFFLDSVCFVQSSAQSDPNADGGIRFNQAFSGDNPVAIFRGTNGGRVSLFVLGDAAGPGASGTGTKSIVNFSLGRVDALIDRLYLARDRTNSSDNASAEATLTYDEGVIDANIAILGYQDNGNNLNEGGNLPTGPARGTLNINGTGLFIVNDTLELGHTTADPADQRDPGSGFGRMSLNNDAVARVNTITVGGVTKATVGNPVQNTITLNGNANLIITNTIGADDAPLGTLTMSGSSKLTFSTVVAGSPRVYVQSFLGNAGSLEILSVPGDGTYPLISYESAVSGVSLILPPGFFGYLVDDPGSRVISAVVSSAPPKSLVWRGNISSDWDTTTANWVDLDTMQPATFTDGDAVLFDDTATGSTVVTVVGTVIPAGGTVFDNTNKSYTITGGTISGTAATLKNGPGSLTIEATHAPALVVSNGAFALSVGGVLNGGLTLRSDAAASSAGTINGPVSVLAGSFVNDGTISTAPGTITVGANTAVTNNGTINVTGQWTVSADAVFANYGRVNHIAAGNNRLTVNGTLLGDGIISDLDGGTTQNTIDGRLVIAAGGVFRPGDTETEVIGEFMVEGRLDINNGSTTIIDIDLNHPATNDVVFADRWSTLQGRIVMNNIGTVPFAVGQSFHIFRNNNGDTFPNSPDNANHIPVMWPLAPGLGMQWDLSDFRTNGIIRIAALAPTNAPTLGAQFAGGTNLTLTWPASFAGYQVQVQTNTLDVGLTETWYPVEGSETTNRVDLEIDPNNPAVFFRLSAE